MEAWPTPMLVFACRGCQAETHPYPWGPIKSGQREHSELSHFLETHRESCGEGSIRGEVRARLEEITPFERPVDEARHPRFLGKHLGVEVWAR